MELAAPFSPTYFVPGDSYGGGGAAVAGVEVLVVGRVLVHVERQNKTPWEHPTQGVVHLRDKRVPFSLVRRVPPLRSPLTSSRASPDLRRFWML